MRWAEQAWLAYEAFFRSPANHAIEIAARIRNGRGLPDLKPLPDETIGQLHRQLTLMTIPAPGAEGPFPAIVMDALAAVDRERLDRRLPGIDTPDQSGITRRLSNLYDVLRRCQDQTAAGAFPAALAAAQEGEAVLAGFPGDLPRHRRGDVAELRLSFALLRAEIYKAQHRRSEAMAAFADAVTRSREADLLEGGRRHTRATVLALCEALPSYDADAALEHILPLTDEALEGDADSDRLALLSFLANFYIRHGDRVAAEEMVGRLKRDLADLGFGDTISGSYLDVLEDWIASARRLSRRHADRHLAFNRAVIGYLTCAAVGQRLPERYAMEHGVNVPEARMEALSALFAEMQACQARVAQRESAAPAVGAAPDAIGAGPEHGDADALPPAPDQAPLQTFGVLAARYKDGDTSDDLVEEFCRLAEDPKCDPAIRGQCLLRLGLIHADRERPEIAAGYFEAAAATGRDIDALDLEIEARTNLVFPSFEKADWRTASRLCGQGIARIEAARRRVNAAYLGAAFMADKTQLYRLGIAAAEKLGDAGTMLQRMELLKARSLQSLPPLQGDATGAAAELKALNDRLHTRNLQPAERNEAMARRRLLWDRTVLARSREQPGFDLARLQRMLGNRAVALNYFFLGDAVLVRSAISGDAIVTEKVLLDNQPDFFDAVDRFTHVTWRSPGVDLDLAAIAPVLLPESFAPLIDAAPQIIVCGHQSLHHVPLAALPWRGAPLITVKPVGTVPNLTCLQSSPPPAEPGLAFLGIASRTSMDSERAPVLPPLKKVEPEAEAAGGIFRDLGQGAELLIGAQASRAAFRRPEVRAHLNAARILHIGLHGSDVAASDVTNAPMEARLYFHDGPLDGIDLAGWPLSADLVVLAACFGARRAVSARGLERLPADSVFGLQAALHEAGARSMIGPLWPGNDTVTPELTGLLYRSLARGRTPAEALHDAVRSFVQTASAVRRDPAFWACFVLVAFSPEAFGLAEQETN